MFGRSIFAALVLAAAVSDASSLEAMLGDAFVTLPVPTGFCELTPWYEFDGRAVATFSGALKSAGNKLLAMSADCGQLAEARAGKRRLPDDMVQYLTPIETPPAASVAQTCTNLRTQGDGLWTNRPDIGARVEGATKEIKTDEMRSIGVLAEDANACYVGSIHKARAEAGTEKTLVATHAVTIISNRPIFVHRFTLYQTPDTVDAVLAKLKGDVAALIAANP
jgi:hypothetical protein